MPTNKINSNKKAILPKGVWGDLLARTKEEPFQSTDQMLTSCQTRLLALKQGYRAELGFEGDAASPV